MILSDVDVTELRDPSALYTDTIDVIDPPELLRRFERYFIRLALLHCLIQWEIDDGLELGG